MLLVLDPLPLLRQYQSSRRDHPGTEAEGEDISVQLGQLSQASSKSPEIETLQSSNDSHSSQKSLWHLKPALALGVVHA